MQLAELLAREAIRDLLTRYTYNGDRGRIDALAACFADNGVLEFPGNSGTGPTGVKAALTSGERNPTISFVRHHVTPPIIELAADGESATARSYFAVTSDNGPDHSGTYDDWLTLTKQGWRFALRRVRIDWQAETSLFRRMKSRNEEGA
ncbi:nuclear transport factor 2 family protein [Sphingomonas lacunae]|uniref:Nuclear transport factor 2 family protein n=1 Tax=Sphingomonas lacunae TaxID=2698828 RepID=A0A6M4AWS1_9SPHN|nr:nuclear transport factor 2 family protein [Sphingomonas lacunae]QJQ31421.1 nuclear transport factor 2 family protein [Sphingomonas lacunae]